MKPTYPNDLGRALVRFFQDYLPAQRGMSGHTIRSYRDAVVLFLRSATQHTGRPVESLDVGVLRPDLVIHFLAQLEAERGNRVATRNARLAALHTLANCACTAWRWPGPSWSSKAAKVSTARAG